MSAFRRLALTAGGLGLLRPAPGTWGSLPPPALAVVMVALGLPAWQVNVALVLLAVAFSVACLRFGAFGETLFGKKDPGSVVADEVAGQSIALLFLPWRGGDLRHALTMAAVAFVAFRALDIVKPPPARRIQSVPGGAGILLDDLVAGAYACAVTQAVARGLL